MSAEVGQLLRTYCAAIDARIDPYGVDARFGTADDVLDNSAIRIPAIVMRKALVAKFTQMFAGMELLEHRISDFCADARTFPTC